MKNRKQKTTTWNRWLAIGFIFNTLLLFPVFCLAQDLLSGPQKVVMDIKRNRLLVSNYNTGDIVQIDSVGNQSYFVKGAGFIDGMEIVGDTVYGASTGKSLKGYDLVTGSLSLTLTIPGTEYLSSIVADSSGNLYISCPLGNMVYKMRISDSTYWVFAGGNGLNYPNGMIYENDKNRLIVIQDVANPEIQAISMADSTVTTLSTTALSGADGIERDKNGNYYITGYYLTGVYRCDSIFSQPPEMIYPGNAIVYPTYESKNHSLLVTCYNDNSLDTLLLNSPAAVHSPLVRDVGTGTELQVLWEQNPESNISGYWVRSGRYSQQYSDSALVNDTSHIITGLTTDSTCYISVWAVNADGFQSLMAVEVSGIPHLAPWFPAGLTAEPIDYGIRLTWLRNTELDFEGCRIYRRVNDQPDYDSLNAILFTDTTLTQIGLSGADKYYYAIRSFDTLGNFGPMSPEAYGRPITLDQGILVVDETNNWTAGSFPRDAQQDSFYNYIMAGYKYEPYEYGSTLQKPVLGDFGPYTTVVWLSDDYTTLLASGVVNDMKSYLDYGGKLWLAGWKPTGDIRNSTIYPTDFSSGNILYDQFKITHAELSGLTDSFKTAIGLKGYPDITIDTLKYPSTLWGKTFRNIEALTPLAGADTIYVMDMKNNGSPYEGRACAVRDSGKTVFFGFPLYFMDREQVKLAVQQVMLEFGEEPQGITGGTDNRGQITAVRLFQNAPNPFSDQTAIRYQVPTAGLVTLKVYNIAGQVVKTFNEGHKPAGCYQIEWSNNNLTNGIYFYRLQAGENFAIKKLMILR